MDHGGEDLGLAVLAASALLRVPGSTGLGSDSVDVGDSREGVGTLVDGRVLVDITVAASYHNYSMRNLSPFPTPFEVFGWGARLCTYQIVQTGTSESSFRNWWRGRAHSVGLLLTFASGPQGRIGGP